MPPKIIKFSADARGRMLRGVNQLAGAVHPTLGPKGRSVLIDRRYGSPLSTQDGVTVAKEIELADPFENMAAQMVKAIASHTNDAAGDGTTTATVLARALFAEGARLAAAGHDPMSLKRGLDKATGALLAALARLSRPLAGRRDIEAVALISSNGDPEIADIVATAFERIGKDGIVSLEDGRRLASELRFVEGLELDRGWLSPQFVTDPSRLEATLEGCLVLVSEKKLSTVGDVLPILTLVTQAKKPLLVVAEDVEGQALQTLVMNQIRGALRCAAIKAPEYGEKRREALLDLSAIVGGRLFSAELGITADGLGVEDLGRARQVVVGRQRTTIIEGGGKKAAIQARARHIRALIAKAANQLDREKLADRLATLLGGVAIVRVGGATEIDQKERRGRFDDAISATRAALEEGVVAGGGVALLRIASALDAVELADAEKPAAAILRRVLEEPARIIAANAGAEPSVVLDRIRKGKGAFGFNAATEEFEDLIKAGVLDPTRVVRIALQSAVSAAGLMLTTEAIVSEGQGAPEKTYLDPPKPDLHARLKPRAGQLK